MSACVNVVMLREVPWPGQGDLGWDLRLMVFSIMLVAITIAWDDAGKKMSKRRPENEPALDSSSREVNSRVEALRFDRRAGALALHFCGFSNRCARSFFFLAWDISGVFFPLSYSAVLVCSVVDNFEEPVKRNAPMTFS